MGGRGGMSGLSGGGAGHNTNGIDYLVHSKNRFELSRAGVQQLAKDLNISEKDARDIGNAVNSFTSDDSDKIRADITGREAALCEQYIDKAPKWNGGTLYRGIFVDGETAETIEKKAKNGTGLSMNGISSWSSDENVSKKWGQTYLADMDDSMKTSKQKSGRSIMFVTNGTSTSKGASVKHLSYHKAENEVMVSSKARFKPTKVESKKDAIYIYGDIR